MNQQPLVSVCIANYNGLSLIDDCIGSVLAQQVDFVVEILIHDDASSDDSPQHIRELYPNVKLIESSTNVGFCVANNRMAAVAKGKYLLLLNNDAALYQDALQTLLGAVNGIGIPAILSLPQYDSNTAELIDRGCLLDPFLNPVPNLDARRSDVAMVIGACLWIPKSLWDEFQGFPEWFGSIGEDLYLCCRARLAGYPVRVLGSSGYRHRVGASFGGGKPVNGELTTTYRRRALSERNKTFVMILSYPTFALYIALPVHLNILLVEAMFLTISKVSLRPWREIYAPLVPALWAAREKLMNLRVKIHEHRPKNSASFFGAFTWFPWKLIMLFMHGIPKLK